MTRNADNMPPGRKPTRPRFTLGSLRKIVIGNGESANTIALYVYTHNGTACEKCEVESLTNAERKAALAFIRQYPERVETTGKGNPRGRTVAGRDQHRRQPAPLDLGQVEFEPLELTDRDFDFEPLQMDFEAPPMDFEPVKLDFEPLELTDRPGPEAEKVLPKPKKSRPHRKQ